MELLTITLAGVPVAKGRARITRNGTFTPNKTRRYESTLRLAAREAMLGRKMFDCALHVSVIVHVPIPASWSKRKKNSANIGTLLPCTKPDLDNYIKIATDALNGVVYPDDNQVVDVLASKRYSEHPRITITISTV